MGRLVNPFEQFFDSAGNPLAAGTLDFFESGSSTVRKTTFADAALTIPNSNPVILTGDGRVPNVFGVGSYRAILKDSDGLQIIQRDPIGGDLSVEFGADWVSTTTYNTGDVARDGESYYRSLVDGNLNNQPSTDSGLNWEPAIVSSDDIVDVSGKKIGTVAEMVADLSLSSGQAVSTLGFSGAGDGGEADYLIQTAAEFGGTPDEFGDHTLDNGNIAALQTGQIIKSSQFGLSGDGVTDDHARIQSLLDRGENVEFATPSVHYEISDTMTLKTSGQIIRGLDSRSCKFINSSNDLPLIYIGDPSVADGFAQNVTIENIAVEGNSLTSGGLTVWAANAVADIGGESWSSSSRNCVFTSITIDEVGAGFALSVYSWENCFYSLKLFSNNDRGILLDWEAQKNTFYDAYITDCDNESIKFSTNGICRSNLFDSVVVQQSGGSSGCIEFAGGDNNRIRNLYSESNNLKGAPYVVGVGPGVIGSEINGLMHLSGGAIVVSDSGKNTSILNVISESGLTASVVKLETTSERAMVVNCDYDRAQSVPNPIWDVSTAGTPTVIGGAEFVSTFTPTFEFVAAPTYATQTGRLRRVGGLCQFDIEIEWSGLDTADASSITIRGLPDVLANDGFSNISANMAESTGLNFISVDSVHWNTRIANQDIELTTSSGGGYSYDSGKINAAGKILLSGSFLSTGG